MRGGQIAFVRPVPANELYEPPGCYLEFDDGTVHPFSGSVGIEVEGELKQDSRPLEMFRAAQKMQRPPDEDS